MDLTIEGSELVVQLEGLERWVALRWSDVRIPRSAIVRADNALPQQSWKQLRAPGTYIPGWIKAGSYFTSAGWEFWYFAYRRQPHPLTLSLAGQKFTKVVLGVSDAGLVDHVMAWCQQPADCRAPVASLAPK